MRSLAHVVETIEALSRPLDRFGGDQSLRRLRRAVGDSSASGPLETALETIGLASRSPRGLLLQRGLAVASRRPRSQEAIARIGQLAESLARSTSEASGDRSRESQVLFDRAAAAACLVAVALDVVGETDGIHFAASMIERLATSGREVPGYGVPPETDSRMLRILVDFAVAMHVGRLIDAESARRVGPASDTMDDLLLPRPWGSHRTAVMDSMRRLSLIRFDDDCLGRGQENAISYCEAAGLIDHGTARAWEAGLRITRHSQVQPAASREELSCSSPAAARRPARPSPQGNAR